MPPRLTLGQRTGATFRDFLDAFVHGLTLKHLGREPRDTLGEVAAFGGEMAPWLLAYEATAPLKGAAALGRLPAVVREMLRFGLASGTTEALTKGSTAGDVAMSAGSTAIVPPVFRGLGAGGRFLRMGLARALPLNLEGHLNRFGPRLGPVTHQLFNLAARSRLQAQEALTSGPRSRWGGVLPQLQRVVQAAGAGLPQVLGGLERSTARLGRPLAGGGFAPSELLKRYARLKGITPEQAIPLGEASFASGAGLSPEQAQLVAQLRGMTQRELAATQAQRRYSRLLEAARVQPGDPGAAAAIRALDPGIKRSILEQYPIETSRLWETYFPRGKPATYIVGTTEGGEFVPAWAERPLARTQAEAQQLAESIAQKLGLSSEEVTFQRIRPNFGEPITELSRPAYFSTIARAAKQMGVDAPTAMETLSGLRIRRPFRRGKFMGALQQRRGLLPEVPPEERLPALQRYFAQSSRFRAAHVPLKALSRIYPQVETAAGGPEAEPTRYLRRWMSDVAGRPSPLEQRFNEAVERGASVPGPAQRILQEWAGDPRVLSKMAGTLRGYQAMTKLGFSPAAALANLAGGLTSVFTKRGARLTIRAVFEALHNPREWRFLGHEVGIQPATMSRTGILGAEGEMPRGVGFVVGASMLPFGMSERMVRKVAAIAGYLERSGEKMPSQLMQSNTKLHREALSGAWETIRDTQFIYSIEALPQFLRGPAGQVLGQFKPFLINQMSLLLGLAPREAFRFFTGMAALTGLGAVPLVEAADEAVFNTLGVSVPGARFLRDIRAEYPRASAGLPGLAGFDIGGSVGVAEHFLPTRLGDVVGGPTVSDIERGVGAYAKGEPVGRTMLSTVRGLRGVAQANAALRGGAVRSPATRELLYRVSGGRYVPLQGQTATEARRLNVPALVRALQLTPRPMRGELARLLPSVTAAQQEQGPKELALLFALGLQPTGVKATRAAQRRYFELQKTYKREEKKGVPRGQRRF